MNKHTTNTEEGTMNTVTTAPAQSAEEVTAIFRAIEMAEKIVSHHEKGYHESAHTLSNQLTGALEIIHTVWGRTPSQPIRILMACEARKAYYDDLGAAGAIRYHRTNRGTN